MKRRWKWAAGVAAVVVLGGAALVAVLPRFVQSTLEERGSAMLGRAVRVGSVEFAPAQLAFTARELSVAGAGADASTPQLTIARVHLSASLASLWYALSQRAPVLDAVEIEAPMLRLARVAPGGLDIDDVVQRLRPPPDAPPSEPARFRLRHVKVVQGAVSFDDRVVGQRFDLTEVQLDAPQLSRLRSEEQEVVESTLSLRLAGAPVALQARVKPFSAERSAELVLDVKGLDLAPWWTYAQALAPPGAPLPVRLTRGVLALHLTARGSLPPGQPPQLVVRGETVLSDAAVDTRAGKPLLAIGRLVVPVDGLQLHDRMLALGAVRVESASMDLRRDAQGRMEVATLRPHGPAPAANPANPADPAQAPSGGDVGAAAAAAPWQLSVARVDIVGAQARWQDASTRPTVSMRLESLDATAERLQWPSAEAVPLTAAATVADAGGAVATLRAEGQLSPHKASLRFELDKLRLQAAAPYLSGIVRPSVAGLVQARGGLEWEAGQDGGPPHLVAALARLQVDALTLAEPGPEEPAVRVRTIAVEGLEVDLEARRLQVQGVRVQSPVLRVERGEDGLLQMQRWVAAGPPSGAAASPRSAGPPWRWSVGRAQVDAAQLHWIDRQRPGAEPVALKADLTRLTLQGLAMPARAPVQVQLAGTLQPPAGSTSPPGKLQARGQLQLAPPGWSGTVDAERLPVHAFEAYYAPLLPVRLANAELGLRGEARFTIAGDGPQLEARTDVMLADVQVDAQAAESGVAAGDRLLAWQSLTLQPVAVRLAPGRRPQVEIGQAQLNDLDTRLVVTEQGRFNLTEQLARRSAGPGPEVQTQAQAGPGGLPLELLVESTTVVNARIDFHDYFIKPNFSAELTELNGKVGRISSESQDMAAIDLRGRAAGTALLEIRGALNPAVRPPVLDLNARATDLELAPLSPYAAKYAGYGIERGKLSLAVAYRIESDGKLEAKNQLILNQLTFGERVDSPTATKLPVRLAVALLADRNGVIDLDLPIGGSINDPQFSIWGLVWKVVVNVLTKAVTAPFSLMTGGSGSEQSWVEFVPGTATIAASGAPVIDKVATALADRPQLRMTVTGSADGAAEREAIQAAMFEARLQAEQRRELARAGRAVAPGVPLPPQSAAERERLVRRLYAETPIPDKPRNAVGMLRPLPLPETEDMLRRQQPVSDDTARELAIQRGLTVRDALIGKGLSSERLFIGAPKVRGTAEDDAAWTPRVSLTLDAP